MSLQPCMDYFPVAFESDYPEEAPLVYPKAKVHRTFHCRLEAATVDPCYWYYCRRLRCCPFSFLSYFDRKSEDYSRSKILGLFLSSPTLLYSGQGNRSMDCRRLLLMAAFRRHQSTKIVGFVGSLFAGRKFGLMAGTHKQ